MAAIDPETDELGDRRIEFDYLRAFLIILVLFHHVVIGYCTFSYLNPENPTMTFSPVVDSHKWRGFNLVVLFNDTFFMALLYFISGLFTWRGFSFKGTRKQLTNRFKRIGLPFIIGVFFLNPFAFYPAQLQIDKLYGGSSTFLGFWSDIFRQGYPSAGPLWFLWLLLAYTILVSFL